MDKLLKTSLIIGILIISFSFGYYFLFFLPSREQIKVSKEKLEVEQEEMKHVTLATCLYEAEQNKEKNEAEIPEILDIFKKGYMDSGYGEPSQADVMKIYSARIEWVNQKFKEDRDYCIKLYK